MHWRELCALGIGVQAQAVGRHFASFSRHYNLLDSKEALTLTELLNEWRISSPETSSNVEPSTTDPISGCQAPSTSSGSADPGTIQQQTKLTDLQVVNNVVVVDDDQLPSS